MEQSMQQHLTPAILEQAVSLYGADESTLSFIGGFENFVYELLVQEQACILRFVHSEHRPYHHVLAELEFIDYLHSNGASVSNVVHSVNDNIVEQIMIDQDLYFTVAVFTKAPGSYVKTEDETPEFWQTFGAEVGKLHRLTKTFIPKNKRPQWYEENFEQVANRWLEDDDQEIIDLFHEVKHRILKIPKTVDNYGLIHTDLHFHNIYYHEGSFTFFDFDDSAYKHFLSDIAIIIYYYHASKVYPRNEFTFDEYQQNVVYILRNFLLGYETQNSFDRQSLVYINEFLLLRSVILYIVLVAAGYKHHEDERYRVFCEQAKHRALHHVMKLDVDKLIKEL